MIPTNNYNDHRFYHFSLTLFMNVFYNNGFYIEDISYVEACGNEVYIPYKVGEYGELVSERKALLYVCARKINKALDKLAE